MSDVPRVPAAGDDEVSVAPLLGGVQVVVVDGVLEPLRIGQRSE